MAKPEWGVKRACLSCAGRFYDLRKSPIVCPTCGATFEPEATLRARRVQRPVAEKKIKVALVPQSEAAAEPLAEGQDARSNANETGDETVVEGAVEGADEEESVIEDTSDLADDDDGVPVVVSDNDNDDDK